MGKAGKRLGYFQRKGEIADWLEYKIQGAHLIALDGILGHVGNKNDDNVLIELPDTFGCGHTIHQRHLNVHQDNVPDWMIILQDGQAICKYRDRKFLLVSFLV